MTTEKNDQFAGDKKAPMVSPLAKIERSFIQQNVGKWPSWIETYHLTLLTIPWSIITVLCGWLADRQGNLHWLWGSSLMLFLQWFTDAFDGAIGRMRNTGLIKWGYYMDHFLDFIFMSAVIASYVFLVEGTVHTLTILLIPLVGAFWVSAFLHFSCTNSFQITQMGMGPTEIRLFFIGVNTAVIFAGPKILQVSIPYFFGLIVIMLALVIYKTHKEIWALDMAAKAEAEKK